MTHEVLWFAAPPVDMPKPSVPKYSLAYLHHLAKKRTRDEFRSETDGMDVEDESEDMQNGRPEERVEMTATERLAAVMVDYPRV